MIPLFIYNALAPDQQADGTFTVTLQSGSGNRTVTRLDLTADSGAWWNTVPGNNHWILGAASTLDGSLLNSSNGSVSFAVTDGGSFKIFVSDYNNTLFNTAQGATRPPRFANGGTAEYYHEDGLGSVVAMTNQAGAVEGSVRYDAWGKAIPVNGTTPPLYGYTGREPDETGLIYYRARYYDPTIGRFIQRDPIGLQGGINLYAYVQNNPINFVDPTGLTANPAFSNAATNFTNYFNTADLLELANDISPSSANGGTTGLKSGYQSQGTEASGASFQTVGFTLPLNTDQAIEANQKARSAFSFLPTPVLDALFPITPEGVVSQLGSTVLGLASPLSGAAGDVAEAAQGIYSRATDPRLLDAIRNLFRPGSVIGTGSTMDAYRFEQATGEFLSQSGHALKLMERRTQLLDLFRDPKLNPIDKQITRDLLIDIQNALIGK